MDSLIGKTLGQYQILDKIGQGGMASVYKAHQPGLERIVAVKVLSSTLAEDTNFTARFQREARSIARLQHPHILQVYDFGEQDGFYYLVMRYVEHSTTLADLMHNGVSENQLIEHVVQVAGALNYAHEHNIIHRDVKPTNILIERHGPLLTDFGLVKIAGSDSEVTQTGVGMGTPAYMSPEQGMGEKVDSRTDIYSLGLILYQILTDKIPHVDETTPPPAIIANRATKPVPPPRIINPNISEGFEQVILRSLTRVPEDRFRTATDFAEAITKAQEDPLYREEWDGATIPEFEPLPPVELNGDRKKRWFIGGGVTAVLLAVMAVSYSLFFSGGTSDIEITPQIEIDTAGLPAETPTPILPSVSMVMSRAELPVYDTPGGADQIQYYLPKDAQVELIGQDRSGGWLQIRTAQGPGWIKVTPDSVEVSGLANVPIVVVPTPTNLPLNTPVPTPTKLIPTPTATFTSSPTNTSIPPTVTPSPSPSSSSTSTPTNTPLPTPTFIPTVTPSPNTNGVLPSPTTTSAPSIQINAPTPNLVEYSGSTFLWEWEGENMMGDINWYFDIKIFNSTNAEIPYDVLVAEPDQAVYQDQIWSFVGSTNFQCGSYWAVQIAQRNSDGTFAQHISPESNRLPIGPSCGGGGGGSDSSGGSSGSGSDGGGGGINP